MKSIQIFGLIAVLLLNTSLINAQREKESSLHWQRKVDPALSRIVATMASSTLHSLESTPNFQRLHLIIQAIDPSVVGKIEELGGSINTKIGDLMTVDVSVEKLPELLALDRVLSAGFGPLRHDFYDQDARRKSHPKWARFMKKALSGLH